MMTKSKGYLPVAAILAIGAFVGHGIQSRINEKSDLPVLPTHDMPFVQSFGYPKQNVQGSATGSFRTGLPKSDANTKLLQDCKIAIEKIEPHDWSWSDIDIYSQFPELQDTSDKTKVLYGHGANRPKQNGRWEIQTYSCSFDPQRSKVVSVQIGDSKTGPLGCSMKALENCYGKGESSLQDGSIN